ncbi:MAG: CRISPR-associated protein [Candidatus Binatia bacterium]|nr:MAG: CRISPR-associated protein [Candidatus Binatia bacterium]
MGWDLTLVFVAGASPQVITETVSALCQRRPVPQTCVFVLTTTSGREHIERALFGRKGAWAALQREYPAAKRFRFSPKHILLLPGPTGAPLDDVRSAAESEAAGNFILNFVRNHTRPESPPLHASIAGGRKTMGYLLATALMLYGRVDDRLSHVLVRPSDIESSSFFFRPRKKKRIKVQRSDGQIFEVSTSEIDVELTDLPFPRLRLLQREQDLQATSFSELVRRLQDRLGQLARPTIEIDLLQHRIVCGGEGIELSPLRVGIYALLAQRRRDAHIAGFDCAGCAACFLPAAELTPYFRDRLRQLMSRLGSVAVGRDWGERNFRPEISKLNAQLQRKLGSASAPYEIQIRGQRKQRLYGIGAPPELLTFRDQPIVGSNVANFAQTLE